jgi:hypothetical protein
MRFTTVWAKVATENVTLKTAVVALTFTSVALLVATTQLALREPLIVERACYTKALQAGTTKHSAQEIEAFLKESLPQRFNNDAVASREMLSGDEMGFRVQEQKSLEQRNIKQRVLVNTVDTSRDPMVVDADRFLSVGSIRSAFPFPLSVKISATTRTELNPYGLILEKVEQLKEVKK